MPDKEHTAQPDSRPGPLAGLTVARLAWINAGLLIALLAVHFAPQATAQNRAADRGRGQYLLLSGEPEDGNLADVFVVDVSNQELISLRWDPQRDNLVGTGYRDLSADIAPPAGR